MNANKNQLLPLVVRISYYGFLYYEQLEQVTGVNCNMCLFHGTNKCGYYQGMALSIAFPYDI